MLDVHPFIARLKTSLRLGPLDLVELGKIMDAEKSIGKHRDLVVDGAEFRQLCFVREGYAIRYKLLRNGKRQILNVILPGDVIGFPISLLDRSTYSVVALTELKLNTCPIDAYVRLCFARPQFALALTWLAANEASIYAERIVDIGRRTPVERLIHFLLELHARLSVIGLAQDKSFDLPISQEVIADTLGLSVPHLNRVMQLLRRDKLISTNARRIEFSDIATLRGLSHYQPLQFAPILVPTNA